MQQEKQAAPPVPPVKVRLFSIDVVRGLVMVLMALDHARHFGMNSPFPPEDMQHTTAALFATRWVTHLCAPLFFLLAGISAWLVQDSAGTAQLRRFLVTRGFWLIALELTVIGFAWVFVPGSSFAGVIWCLGWSFLSLAALSYLGPRTALVLGAALIVLHGLADDVEASSLGRVGFLYQIAHQAGPVRLPGNHPWFVLFPWVPWIGVMWLGYGMGALFALPAAIRRRRLFLTGAAFVALFLVLRLTNAYGNPSWSFQRGGQGHFQVQADVTHTLIALLNTEKYPPSLQFLLMTLGPGLWLLSWFSRRDEGGTPSALERALAVFGRTPFLFYLLHLYAFHLAAWGVGALLGQPVDWLGWGGGRKSPQFGFGLPGVYALWLGVTALLFVPCAWFAALRARRSDWWLKYL